MAEEGGHELQPRVTRTTTEKPTTASSASSTAKLHNAPEPIKITEVSVSDGVHLTQTATYDEPLSPIAGGAQTPIPWAMRRTSSFDLDDYFTGPRDMGRHSKWPVFLQMHGSILPKMVMPLIFIGGWATGVTIIHKKVTELGVQSTRMYIYSH